MRIEILTVPDCPNRTIARRRLDEALATTRTRAEVIEAEVHYVRAAERLGMRGSPTILIDGGDPFGRPEVSISCRLYATEAGIEGAPSVEQLVEALS